MAGPPPPPPPPPPNGPPPNQPLPTPPQDGHHRPKPPKDDNEQGEVNGVHEQNGHNGHNGINGYTVNNLNNPPPLPIKPSSENKTRRTWGGALPGESPNTSMSNASIDTSQTYTSTESTLHSSSSIKPNEQLPPIPQDQSTSGEEIMPFKGRKKRETSIDGTSSLRLSSTQWTETLERRSKSSSSNTLKVKSKRSTYSGKTLSVLIKGNVLNMNRNPFEDFPEIKFKPLPKCNVIMDKKQTKERDSIVDEISKSREKMIFDRDSAFKAQQKREEKLMKQFQDEINDRATAKIKEFQKKLEQTKKDRKDAKDPMSSKEVKNLVSEYEENVTKNLEESQTELESRLIKQRLKWILPWFQSMRGVELTQYAQLHSFEVVHLEEKQQEERKDLESTEQSTAKVDFESFEKDLKGTIKQRKKANRPMAKEEVRWEKEVFEKKQNEQFEEKMKALQIIHQQQREQLEIEQQTNLDELVAYYENLEATLLGQSNST